MFGTGRNSRVLKAAAAALSSRVRFTCAAYVPVSRSLLSDALLPSSGGRSWRVQLDDLASSGTAAAAGVAALSLYDDSSMLLKHQGTTSSGGIGLPLSTASGASMWLQSHTLLVVPACCWLRRACRSLVRTALAEDRLPLLERPQRPLSLLQAILCQWKLLLERQLKDVWRSDSEAVGMVEPEPTHCAHDTLVSASVGSPLVSRDGVDEVLRRLREPERGMKLLETAAEAVIQKIQSIRASAWQLPPVEWWTCARTIAAGKATGPQLEQGCMEIVPYDRSSSSHSTSSLNSAISSRADSDGESASGRSEEAACGSGRDKGRKLENPTSVKERGEELISQTEGSRETVEDIGTGQPLLQTELQYILNVFKYRTVQPADDSWRLRLSLSDLSTSLRMFYSQETALLSTQASMKALLLLRERVTRGAASTGQDANAIDFVVGKGKKSTNGLCMFGSIEEPLRSESTASPNSQTPTEAVLPSTVGRQCELLLEAAVSSIHSALYGRNTWHTNGNINERADVAATVHVPIVSLCLPTPAWQLLHPVAVQPWEGCVLPVDALCARAQVRRHSDSSKAHRGRWRVTRPEQLQRGRQSRPQTSQKRKLRAANSYQEVSCNVHAEREERCRTGKNAMDNEGVLLAEELSGDSQNVTKGAQMKTGIELPQFTGEKRREQRHVAASLQPSDIKGGVAKRLHQGKEPLRQKDCMASNPFLRDMQDNQLTRQVLASVKECRQRAALEQKAIKALLSAARERLHLPTDRRHASGTYTGLV